MSCLPRSAKTDEIVDANYRADAEPAPVILSGVGSNIGEAQVVRQGNLPNYCGKHTVIYETVAAPSPQQQMRELQEKNTMTY